MINLLSLFGTDVFKVINRQNINRDIREFLIIFIQ